MPVRPRRAQSHTILALLAAVSVVSLAGCQQRALSLDSADPLATGSTAPPSFTETAKSGKAWQADQADIAKGVAYANGLERIGQTEQQLAVYARLHDLNPDNGKLATLYGKKLVQAGKSSQAVPLLETAARSPDADWRVFSALGSAQDQQGQFDKAQESYNRALALKPNELTVLNNMGMSYALQGELKQAESVLRQAMAVNGSAKQPRIRQNLALVVGLQGRFDEARQIASEDLPPDQVEANLDYLKKMMSQPNTWQQLSDGDSG